MVPSRAALAMQEVYLRDRSNNIVRRHKQEVVNRAAREPVAKPISLEVRIRLIFHLAVVIYCTIVNYTIVICSQKLLEIQHPVTKMFLKGTTQFFTDWTQVIYQSYFMLSLIDDLLSLHGGHERTRASLTRLRRRIFGPVLLPATCLTAGNFWTCYAIAPDLMMADIVALYPASLNHAVHTFIVPIAYVEMLTSPQMVVPRSQGLKSVTMLMSGYASWMYFISYVTGLWPYRFLVVMNLKQHALFIPFMHAVGYMWYFVNETLIKIVWTIRGIPRKSQ